LHRPPHRSISADVSLARVADLAGSVHRTTPAAPRTITVVSCARRHILAGG
jgi:hypothetical protein